MKRKEKLVYFGIFCKEKFTQFFALDVVIKKDCSKKKVIKIICRIIYTLFFSHIHSFFYYKNLLMMKNFINCANFYILLYY